MQNLQNEIVSGNIDLPVLQSDTGLGVGQASDTSHSPTIGLPVFGGSNGFSDGSVTIPSNSNGAIGSPPNVGGGTETNPDGAGGGGTQTASPSGVSCRLTTLNGLLVCSGAQ
jgi:hypothetical protein